MVLVTPKSDEHFEIEGDDSQRIAPDIRSLAVSPISFKLAPTYSRRPQQHMFKL